MTGEEIKELAVRFKPMPDGLNAAETLYFVTMRRLSADFRQKRISAETARIEGNKARRAFEQYSSDCRFARHSAELWRNIEAAGTRYGKERTLEAAEEFYRTVYGLKKEWSRDETGGNP